MPTASFSLQAGSRVGIRYWSDIQPATVVAVSRSGRRVTVRRDRADRDPAWQPAIQPGGFAGHCSNQHDQQWLITEDPNGPTAEFSLRHDGQWWSTNAKVGTGSRLVDGWRCFYDYNF